MGYRGDGKGRLAESSKGRGPVSVPRGGASQQGHPVPLREGGAPAPLRHPVLPSILTKSKRKMKEGSGETGPNHFKVLYSALTSQRQLQGEWLRVRVWGLWGPVRGCWGVLGRYEKLEAGRHQGEIKRWPAFPPHRW